MIKSYKRIKTKIWNLTNSRRQILSISFLSFFYSSFCQRKYVSVDRWQNQSEHALILVVVIHYSHLLWPVIDDWSWCNCIFGVESWIYVLNFFPERFPTSFPFTRNFVGRIWDSGTIWEPFPNYQFWTPWNMLNQSLGTDLKKTIK